MNESQMELFQKRERDSKRARFYGAVLWFWAILLFTLMLAGFSGALS